MELDRVRKPDESTGMGRDVSTGMGRHRKGREHGNGPRVLVVDNTLVFVEFGPIFGESKEEGIQVEEALVVRRPDGLEPFFREPHADV